MQPGRVNLTATMRRRTLAFVATLPLLLGACQTRAAIRNAPSDAGIAASYAGDFDRVKQASRDAVAEASFTVREDGAWDKAWRIVATQGLSSGTVGRMVRVVLQPGMPVGVHVLVRSKVDTREAEVADDALAQDIHKRIAARLAPR